MFGFSATVVLIFVHTTSLITIIVMSNLELIRFSLTSVTELI